MAKFTNTLADHDMVHRATDAIILAGRVAGLGGVVIVLLMIGALKFTQVEIDGLVPIIGPTPWLAWMYTAFGAAASSYILGVIELVTAFLLILAPWPARAGLIGGAIASLTFFVTASIMFAAPIWETASGGFPWINELGQFLVKDVALLGVALVVFGESLAKTRDVQAQTAASLNFAQRGELHE